MRVKRIVIDPDDVGSFWEDCTNKLLKGAVHVHTAQAPYNVGINDRNPILVYAFYPDEEVEIKGLSESSDLYLYVISWIINKIPTPNLLGTGTLEGSVIWW